MNFIQTTEAIDKAIEVASIGKNASVTTIGVMAILCLILLGFTIAIWRAKIKKENEANTQNLQFLEAITTANLILSDVKEETKISNTKIAELNSVLNEMRGFINGLKKN